MGTHETILPVVYIFVYDSCIAYNILIKLGDHRYAYWWTYKVQSEWNLFISTGYLVLNVMKEISLTFPYLVVSSNNNAF